MACPVGGEQLRRAVVAAAEYRDCRSGELGIRVTDDSRIHRINRDHLHHDYPTDVISFGYALDPPRVEGELVVSVETARREAARLGWQPAAELSLYVVHGVLHIAGMDDAAPDERSEMRRAERAVLHRLGIDEIDRFGADRSGGAREMRTASRWSNSGEELA